MKLKEIEIKMLSEDPYSEMEALKDQILQHDLLRRWIVKAPVEVLQANSDDLLSSLETHTGVPAAATIASRVATVLAALSSQKARLVELWQTRKNALDCSLQEKLFDQDFDKLLGWISDQRQLFVSEFTDIGDGASSSDRLLQEHRSFEKVFQIVQEHVEQFSKVTKMLMVSSRTPEKYLSAFEKLDLEWNRLRAVSKKRGINLDMSVRFFTSSKEFVHRCKRMVQDCEDMQLRSFYNTPDVENTLTHVTKLQEQVVDSFSTLSNHVKRLLRALEKPPEEDQHVQSRVGSMSMLAQPSVADANVMNTVLLVHEMNRVATSMLDRTSNFLQQKLFTCKFIGSCQQHTAWFAEKVDVFFLMTTYVSNSLGSVQELLDLHLSFEQETKPVIGDIKDLVDQAKDMCADANDTESDSIANLTSTLRLHALTWTEQLDKRKGILHKLHMLFSDVLNIQRRLGILDGSFSDLHQDSTGNLAVASGDCETLLSNLINLICESESAMQKLQEVAGCGDPYAHHHAEDLRQCLLHIEKQREQLARVKSRLESDWLSRKQQHNLWSKIISFEKEFQLYATTLAQRMNEWMETPVELDLVASNRTMMAFIQDFDLFQSRLRQLAQQGRDLLCQLQDTPRTTTNHAVQGSIDYLQSLLYTVDVKQQNLKTFYDEQHCRLQDWLDACQLEFDSRNIQESIANALAMLKANTESGYSLAECEAMLWELDQPFKMQETTHVAVNEIREKCIAHVQRNIPGKALVNAFLARLESAWDELHRACDNKRSAIMASLYFYRQLEQMTAIGLMFMEGPFSRDSCLEHTNKTDGRAQIDRLKHLVDRVKEEVVVISQRSDELRELGDMVKTWHQSGTVLFSNSARIVSHIQEVLDQVAAREARVISVLTSQRASMEKCIEFLLFEEACNQALTSLTDKGDSLLSTLSSCQTNEDIYDTDDQRLPCFQATQSSFKEIKGNVRDLLTQACKLNSMDDVHSAAITCLAEQLDSRYKDLAKRLREHRMSMDTCYGSLPGDIVYEDGPEWPSLHKLEITDLRQNNISNDSGIHDMVDQKRRSLKRREMILNELLQTEQAYVSDLACCFDNFLTPMQLDKARPAYLYDKEQVIFGNLEDIYNFHNIVFLPSLQLAEADPEEVAFCFTRYVDQFQMYIDYCINKPASNTFLIEKAGSYFEKLQKAKHLDFSLAAYLIKPVQRITKYQLLLKELVGCCEESNSVKAALEVMLMIPKKANDTMYINQIEGLMANGAALGKMLLKEDVLVWDVGKLDLIRKGKRMTLFLFEQTLLFCKEGKDTVNGAKFSIKLRMKTSEIEISETLSDDSLKFSIWTGDSVLGSEKRIIKVDGLESKASWVRELRNLSQQFRYGILTVPDSFSTGTLARKQLYRKYSQRSMNGLGKKTSSEDLSCYIPSESTDDTYFVMKSFLGQGDDEVSVSVGDTVKVLLKPSDSKCWLVRVLASSNDYQEGYIPSKFLQKMDDLPKYVKNSSSSLASHSSTDSYSSSVGSSVAVGSGSSAAHNSDMPSTPNLSRNRSRTIGFSTLSRLKPWGRKSIHPEPPSPSLVVRNNRGMSGGGSRKLQHLLGATENDVNQLLKVADMSPSVHSKQIRNSWTSEDSQAISADDSVSSDGICRVSMMSLTSRLTAESDLITQRCEELYQSFTEQEKAYLSQLHCLAEQVIPALKKTKFCEPIASSLGELGSITNTLLDWHTNAVLGSALAGSYTEFPGTLFSSVDLWEPYWRCASVAAKLLNRAVEQIQQLRSTGSVEQSFDQLITCPVYRIKVWESFVSDFKTLSSSIGRASPDVMRAAELIQSVSKITQDSYVINSVKYSEAGIFTVEDLVRQETVEVGISGTNCRMVTMVLLLYHRLVHFCYLDRSSEWFGRLQLAHSHPISAVSVNAKPDEANQFVLWSRHASGTKVYNIRCTSPQSKQDWLDSIRAVIREVADNVSSTSTIRNEPKTWTPVIEGTSTEPPQGTLSAGAFPDEMSSQKVDWFTAGKKYKSRASDELSVSKGDTLILDSTVADSRPGFVRVRKSSNQAVGYVPLSLLKDYDGEEVREPRGFGMNRLRRSSFMRRSSSVGANEKRKMLGKKTSGTGIDDGTLTRKSKVFPDANAVTPLSPDPVAFTVMLKDLNCFLGDDVTFAAGIECGNVRPALNWIRNASPLELNPRKYNVSFDGHSAMLTIFSVQHEDQGIYRLEAFCQEVVISCCARLIVADPPVPESPRPPTVCSMGSGMAEVSYQFSEAGHLPSLFIVEYQAVGSGTDQWVAVLPSARRSPVLVDFLTAGVRYIFRVKVTTGTGQVLVSDPSEEFVCPPDCFEAGADWLKRTWRIDDYFGSFSEAGKGRHSIVRKCKDLSLGRDFALKIIDKRKCLEDSILKEARMISRLVHPHIVGLRNIFCQDKQYVYVLEAMSRRLIDHFLHSDSLTEGDVANYTLQVLTVLLFLHNQGTAYLDLRPENLLLDAHRQLKLTNFWRASSELPTTDYLSTMNDDVEFLAPEMIQREPVDQRADCWALGGIVYLMVFGESPFYSSSVDRMRRHILSTKYPIPMGHQCPVSSALIDFIRTLLVRDVELRPNCSILLQHPWLKDAHAYQNTPLEDTLSLLPTFVARRRYLQETLSSK